MWEFIKSSPWTWAVAGVVVLLIVGALIWISVRGGGWQDRGFMMVEGKALRWITSELPITAMAHPDLSPAWKASYQAAASRINGAVGLALFDPVIQPTPRGYNLYGPFPAGFIVVWPRETTGEFQVDHGQSDLRWRAQDKTIYAATVSVPAVAAERNAVMLHELGHVLGLDHDDDNLGSIMYSKLGGRIVPGEVTVADADRLRKVYG
jgi:hypothetical protein